MPIIRQCLIYLIAPILVLSGMQGCSSINSLSWLGLQSSKKNSPVQSDKNNLNRSDDLLSIAVYSSSKVITQIANEKMVSSTKSKVLIGSSKSIDHLEVIGLDNQEVEEGISNDEDTNEDSVAEEVTVKNNFQYASGGKSAEENTAVDREMLMTEIINLLGTYYQFGGTNALGGIDCSAFVGTIFSRALGVRLPRTSNGQYSSGKKVRKDKLLIGDLVFFKTRRSKRTPVSHVGIYIGNHFFTHSSRRFGVIVSSLQSRYYSKTYVGARRFIDQPDVTKFSEQPAMRSDYFYSAN